MRAEIDYRVATNFAERQAAMRDAAVECLDSSFGYVGWELLGFSDKADSNGKSQNMEDCFARVKEMAAYLIEQGY